MILSDFGKALAQAVSPAFLLVFLKALAVTVVIFLGVWTGAGWLASLLPVWSLDLPLLGTVSTGGVATGLAVLAAMAASVFLMVPVAAVSVGFFLDDIAAAVEARHHPGLPPVAGQPILEALTDSLGFLGLMVAANAGALLLYLLSGPLAPVVFWLVNGFLLGREYFHMVAVRRLPSAEAAALRRRHFGQVWLAGVLMAVPLSFPLLNLVVPVLAAATFTHLFHRLRGQQAG